MATSTVTVALTGLGAAETGEVFSRLPGAVAVSQGTRVGNGNVTTAALDTSLIYAIWSQGKSAGGFYGIASNFIFVSPGSSADATSRLSAWLNEVKNLFINSTNLLAWIQTVDGTETTSGHVFLGYDPRLVAKVEETKGPTVFIWPENYLSQNELSAKTYRDTFDILVEIVWFNEHRKAHTYLEEINFISDILDEAKAKGTTLDSTFLGEIYSISAPDIVVDPRDARPDRTVNIRFSVRSGTAG